VYLAPSLYELGQAFFGAESPQTKEWVEVQQKELKADGLSRVLDTIQALEAKSEEQEKVRATVMGYFKLRLPPNRPPAGSRDRATHGWFTATELPSAGLGRPCSPQKPSLSVVPQAQRQDGRGRGELGSPARMNASGHT
jgi:hypothetical protein